MAPVSMESHFLYFLLAPKLLAGAAIRNQGLFRPGGPAQVEPWAGHLDCFSPCGFLGHLKAAGSELK